MLDYEKIKADAKAAELNAIRKDKIKYLSISVMVVFFVLLVWQLAVQFELVSTRFFDSPIGVIQTIITKISSKNQTVACCINMFGKVQKSSGWVLLWLPSLASPWACSWVGFVCVTVSSAPCLS